MLQRIKNKIANTSGVKKIALLICIGLLLFTGGGSTVAYIVTGTPTLINTFLNGLNPDGNLVILKTVSHPFGDNYTISEKLHFTFEVDLGKNYANETVKTSHGEKTADGNGKMTVTVTANERTTIYDIDDETEVKVTEIQIGKGFTSDSESQSVKIQKYKDNVLSFTNTYVPEKADTSALTVSGTKSLVGRDWLEGDSFTFALDVFEDGEWKSLGNQSVTYELEEQPDPENPENTILVPKTDFNKFDFTELIQSYEFKEVGTFSFRVTEIEGTVGGITYDKAESQFDVVVGDADMDGFLEIQSVQTTSKNTEVKDTVVSIFFENSYAPYGSAESYIKITKNLEDLSGQNLTPVGFTFELYDEEGNLLTTSEETTVFGETSIRLIYTPDDAGKTFNYTLKETGSGQTIDGLAYDSAEYRIQVSVVDNLDGTVSAYIYDYHEPVVSDRVDGGEPTSAIVIPENAGNVYEAAFTNRYDPQDVSVEINGNKSLTGRKLKAGEFVFDIYETDVSYIVAADAKPICKAQNASDGTFGYKFENFNEVGTHYYVVTENTENSLGGITYDTSRYLVKIVITDNKGILNAETTITNERGEVSDISFINHYKAAPVSLTLTGTKVLNGAELTEGRFSFQLAVADETFTAQNEAFQTVTNDANGVFTFADITFTEAGTYRYVAMEDCSAAETGMTYDDRTYCITVTVTDPGDGQLVISGVDMSVAGEAVSEIQFTNTYEEQGEIIPPDEPDTPAEPDGPVNPEVPDKPSGADKTDSEEADSTDTGDDNRTMLYVTIALVSGIAVIVIVVVMQRRKLNNK